MKEIKEEIYDTLATDVTLQTLLDTTILAPKVYHAKKPSDVTEKSIVYQEIIGFGSLRAKNQGQEAYQVIIESTDPDTNDEIYERVIVLLDDLSFSRGNALGHRLRRDETMPDLLLEDKVTWQIIVRYVLTLERGT